jgi:hypothetical protein
LGSAGSGSPAGNGFSIVTPLAARPSVAAATPASTHTINAAGARGVHRFIAISRTISATPSARVGGCALDASRTASQTRRKNASRGSASPVSAGSCDSIRISAAPLA